MPVTSVSLISVSIEEMDEFQGRAQAVWWIDTDTVMGTREAMIAAQDSFGLPKIGSTYNIAGDTAEPSLFCTSISVEREGQGTTDRKEKRFTAAVGYETVTTTTTPGTGLIAMPTQRWYEEYSIQRPVVKAQLESPASISGGITWLDDDVPLCNTMAADFDTPVYESITNLVYCQQKSFTSLNDIKTVHDDLKGTRSEDVFLDYPKKHARFLSLQTSKPQFEKNTPFWTVTLRIQLSANEPFQLEIVNRGWRHRLLINGKVETVEAVNSDDPDDWDPAAACRLDAKQTNREYFGIVNEPVMLYAHGANQSFRIPKDQQPEYMIWNNLRDVEYSGYELW